MGESFLNKHLVLVALGAFSAVIAALCALGTPVVAHADSATSTASVSFTMPKNSTVAIDKVPDIDFSAAKVSNQAQDVDASSVDTAVSVTNPGFANGWSVSVAATDFVSANDQERIHSAQLTFDQAAIQSAAAAVAPSDTAATTITTGGDAATLISANAQSSRGTTTANYAATAIHLHIPAGNAKADYSADLDWTLSNAVQ